MAQSAVKKRRTRKKQTAKRYSENKKRSVSNRFWRWFSAKTIIIQVGVFSAIIQVVSSVGVPSPQLFFASAAIYVSMVFVGYCVFHKNSIDWIKWGNKLFSAIIIIAIMANILMPASSFVPSDKIIETTKSTGTSASTPVPTDIPVLTETSTLAQNYTSVPTEIVTSKPTETFVPTKTSTPAPTETSVPTETVTPEPTETPVPTETVTPEPTETPVPTETVTPEPTETSVPTETSTPAPTETSVPTETVTPAPTETPLPTETVTPAPTETPLPTTTPTNGGCGPGYWKNHLDAWALTGYSLSDDFDTVFGVDLFDPDITLEQALDMQGGGIERLARQGTAALLNASHPDVYYPLTVAEVIALVQAGDVDTLAAYNESVCPLN